jgi:hypothetical protein
MEGDLGRVDERALQRQEQPKRGTIYRAPAEWVSDPDRAIRRQDGV